MVPPLLLISPRAPALTLPAPPLGVWHVSRALPRLLELIRLHLLGRGVRQIFKRSVLCVAGA